MENKVTAGVLYAFCDEVAESWLACSKQWLGAGVMSSPANRATPPLAF